MKGKHEGHAKSSTHYRWRVGMVSSTGYVKLRVGKAHALADANGYAYEHLVVWVAHYGERPPKGYVIHHANGEKTDNRIENLDLISRSNHNRHHNAERPRGASGRFGKKP